MMLSSRVEEYGIRAAEMLRVSHHLTDIRWVRLGTNLVLGVYDDKRLPIRATDHQVGNEFETLIQRKSYLPIAPEGMRNVPAKPSSHETLEQLRHLDDKRLKFSLTCFVGRHCSGKNEVTQPMQSLIVAVQSVVCSPHAFPRLDGDRTDTRTQAQPTTLPKKRYGRRLPCQIRASAESSTQNLVFGE